jgi:hypothetical protein
LTLERVAEQHEEAARLWQAKDDAELARIERRSATLTRQMAALERECAEIAERRAAASGIAVT